MAPDIVTELPVPAAATPWCTKFEAVSAIKKLPLPSAPVTSIPYAIMKSLSRR